MIFLFFVWIKQAQWWHVYVHRKVLKMRVFDRWTLKPLYFNFIARNIITFFGVLAALELKLIFYMLCTSMARYT